MSVVDQVASDELPDEGERAWALAYGDDIRAAWRDCPRAEWLLRMAVSLGVDGRTIALAATDCARILATSAGEPPAAISRALDAVERWAAGAATAAECHAAAVEAANTATPAGTAAAYAAFTAVSPEYARGVMMRLGDPAAGEDSAAVQQRCLDAVHGRIPTPPGERS